MSAWYENVSLVLVYWPCAVKKKPSTYLRQSSVYNPRTKIKNQQKQQDSKVHNTTLVLATSRNTEENISCGPSIPRHIVDTIFCRLQEANPERKAT